MKQINLICAAIIWWQAAIAGAIESPTLNAKKYPQDTPQNTLSSIIKAMDAKDYAYWATWLITLSERDCLLKKYKNLEGLIAANSDPKREEKIKAQSEIFKKMLASNAVTEGATRGVKWARFALEEVVLQVEKQTDNRWVMNMKIRNAQSIKEYECGEAPGESSATKPATTKPPATKSPATQPNTDEPQPKK